jgi:hypothetical protein
VGRNSLRFSAIVQNHYYVTAGNEPFLSKIFDMGSSLASRRFSLFFERTALLRAVPSRQFNSTKRKHYEKGTLSHLFLPSLPGKKPAA